MSIFLPSFMLSSPTTFFTHFVIVNHGLSITLSKDCKRDLETVISNAKREEQNRLEEERNRLFTVFVTRR